MFAIADYEPRDADEIALVAGDGVFLNLAFADGWGSGFHTTTQASGYFPLSFVTSVPPTPGMPPSGEPTAPPLTTPRLESRPQFAQQVPITPPSSTAVRDVVGPPSREVIANSGMEQGQGTARRVAFAGMLAIVTSEGVELGVETVAP
ncbi:hypothetical protein M427DRAFT_56728 [Gonapodya prolifera JEL478]|uniref:SH3 domain-containing protein n=1 Tax=Gonapodya prolifera (strain JEL478) TaxID=1344416 RepID=A0A139AG26_GONPJ|nr:hypothetical protein M427DRAFT_56728 [Gonapodya prolifera JEL478]|eukprot:KXS15363.1 hypothetical protein M427DRAFT_56728 [Gonapodya prolifera JEL478]